MTLSRAKRAAAVTAVGVLFAAGCGGTLEGRYRRGQLTTSTTRGTQPAGTSQTTPTTAATAPTSGNAAESDGRGEPEGVRAGGTIGGGAVWRSIAPPLGGRHR